MMDDLTHVEGQFTDSGVSAADVEVGLAFAEFALGPARSIRLRMLGAPSYEVPDAVYMIYMQMDAQGKLIVKQVSERPFAGSKEQAEARLLAVARGTAQPGGNIRDEGINFEDIVWRRPHYITCVIDNAGWKIHWGPGGLDDPLRFLPTKPGSSIEYVTENYTFFDAERVQNLGAGDAFRCINYFHRDEFGNELLNDDERNYCFQLYLETPFAVLGNPTSHIVLIVDPDGQNQGPRT